MHNHRIRDAPGQLACPYCASINVRFRKRRRPHYECRRCGTEFDFDAHTARYSDVRFQSRKLDIAAVSKLSEGDTP
jgi:transposase-like protein